MAEPDEMIDRIYEAAAIPALWFEVLTSIATVAGMRGGVLIARSGQGVSLVGSDDDFLRDAMEYFDTFSSHNERLSRLLRKDEARFIADHHVFGPAEILEEPIFRDFLIPRGYGRGAATFIQMPTGEQVILHLEGAFEAAPIAADKMAYLDSLRPHLARAAMLSSRTAFVATRSMMDALERVGLPAVALNSQGRVLDANTLFQAEAQEWIGSAPFRMTLRDPNADRLFVDALGRANSGNMVQSIPAWRETGPGVVHVLPVMRTAATIFGQAMALAVFMGSRPARQLEIPLLRGLFDLTTAEAHVAQDLAAGLSASEIAAKRRTTILTVKGQIKRVMVKTGCHRKTELLTLLVQLALPLGG